MQSVLILFAHPIYERSRSHRRLIQALSGLEHVHLHDLYEAYPDFFIDVAREHELLAEHDHIVLQFPLYWFSTPSLLKEWQDLVLQRWAEAQGGANHEAIRPGRLVQGKTLSLATTTGDPASSYEPKGEIATPLQDIFLPLRLTAQHAGFAWQPPFVLTGVDQLDETGLELAGEAYRDYLLAKLYPQGRTAPQ